MRKKKLLKRVISFAAAVSLVASSVLVCVEKQAVAEEEINSNWRMLVSEGGSVIVSDENGVVLDKYNKEGEVIKHQDSEKTEELKEESNGVSVNVQEGYNFVFAPEEGYEVSSVDLLNETLSVLESLGSISEYSPKEFKNPIIISINFKKTDKSSEEWTEDVPNEEKGDISKLEDKDLLSLSEEEIEELSRTEKWHSYGYGITDEIAHRKNSKLRSSHERTPNFVTRKGDTVVQEYGQRPLSEAIGIGREQIMNNLNSHVKTNFYLSTPYQTYDWRNPNGDPSGVHGAYDVPGVPGMNCTGFVWYVLTASGGKNVPGNIGWVDFLEQNNIKYRTYTGSNINNIIDTINHEDHFIEPGDIIWMWDASVGGMQNGLSHGISDHHHIGIYVGTTFDTVGAYPGWIYKVVGDPNGMWHSSDMPLKGNQIGNIVPKAASAAITVVKAAPPKPKKGSVGVEKVSAKPDLTQGNGNYSLESAIYGVYRNRECTQGVGRITTDKSGKGKLGNLDLGTYYIKEIQASPGYNLDPNVYTVQATPD